MEKKISKRLDHYGHRVNRMIAKPLLDQSTFYITSPPPPIHSLNISNYSIPRQTRSKKTYKTRYRAYLHCLQKRTSSNPSPLTNLHKNKKNWSYPINRLTYSHNNPTYSIALTHRHHDAGTNPVSMPHALETATMTAPRTLTPPRTLTSA